MTWDLTTLGESGDWVSGGTPSTSNPDFWGGDIPWISSKSLTEFLVKDSDRRVTELGATKGTKLVPKDTILMVVRGMSLKSEFRMGITQREVALSQDLKGLLPSDRFHPMFLAYALKARTSEVLGMVDEAGHGTGRLQTDRLFALKTPVPPIEEQRSIAATLGALDDKIESNRRLVELIPGLIRARVLHSIEEGAQRVPVSSLASFVNGGAYTKHASGTGRMVIRIAELNGGPGGSTVYNDIDVPGDKTARPGDILMSWSGSLGVYRWARDEAIINQHIFKVIPSTYPAWLVFDRADAVIETFRAIARDKATTMGHIQRGHLDSTLIEVPAPEAVQCLDHTLGPMWERLLVAERESLRLAALRDALLPELLSGRIRVPEAAAVVQDGTE
ncbi:MAG: hypothetical protein CMH84_15185 [Nocardioides sp.]|nr:hypothetical protein [Nocardioides sp.]